jgi:lipopolysaccharide transport system permease protein
MSLKLWQNRRLVLQLTRRELLAKYKGSVLGLVWFAITPLLMLCIYTFFFSTLFDAKFGNLQIKSEAEFASLIFSGLIVHGFFSEVITKDPDCIRSNPSFIKKIVFPLEILPVIVVLVSGVQLLMGLFILGLVSLFLGVANLGAILWLPVIFTPFLVASSGIALVLASSGVFLRDLNYVTSLLTTALLFVSPIFFPVSALPSWIQPWILLNPLTMIVEQLRSVLLLGYAPDLSGLLLYGGVSIIIFILGKKIFFALRPEFADVV